MKSYGQFCPVAKAAEIFCERWTALILRDLSAGAQRFADLRRGVPLMSPTLLSHRLQAARGRGHPRSAPVEGRPRLHVSPDARGPEFAPIVQALGVWGRRWSRRDLDKHEVDLGLLIWSMERSVRGDALGPGRAVVQVEFTDQPAAQRRWWFLHEDGGTQLCFEDPGFDVDVYLSATLPDMIRIVRGDLTLGAALEQERLEVTCAGGLRRACPAWFNLSPLAGIRSQRAGGR